MRTFQKYIKIREGLGDEAGDPIERQDVQEIFKTIWSRYRDSFMDFMKGLADNNEDEDLKALINKLNGGGSDLPAISKSTDNEVVPPNSDRGRGESGDE